REGEEKRPIEVDRPIVSVVGNFAIVAFNNACKEEPSSAKSQDTVTFHLSGPEPESSEGSNEVNQHG
ncbi:hypothetical protein Tco_0377135, partial [Tanacetum coccineum]